MRAAAFVSGLWGDAVTLAYPGQRPYKVLDDARATAAWEHKAEPRLAFAFGQTNADFLHSLGFREKLLNAEAVVNYTGATERNPNSVGSFNFGASIWRQKIECMVAAFEEPGVREIVWLDWDIRPMVPVPADFWGQLQRGQPFQAALTQRHRKQCSWRATEPRKLHHGGFVYVRGYDTVCRLAELAETRPELNDELLYGLLVDELMGGKWLGSEQYKEMGFEPWCYNVANGAVFPKENEVFRNCGR